eukprot:1655519-Rhodomonas_salina.1
MVTWRRGRRGGSMDAFRTCILPDRETAEACWSRASPTLLFCSSPTLRFCSSATLLFCCYAIL